MNFLKDYASFLKRRLKIERPLKIVCDGSNGSVGPIIEEVFKNQSKLKTVLINGRPDGRFPAHGPNPLAAGALNQCAEQVRKEKADLGAVFDADGDRVFFLDEAGRPLPSFAAAALLFQTARPPFVADELVFQTLKFLKIFPVQEIFPSKVGSFFVKSALKERNATVGAEYSGHFYFKDFFYSDSGLLALIKLANFLSADGRPLSASVNQFPTFFVRMENRPVKSRTGDFFKRLKNRFGKQAKTERRDGLTLVFSAGFLNVRASNTEPLLRLTAGAGSQKSCRGLIKQVKKSVF